MGLINGVLTINHLCDQAWRDNEDKGFHTPNTTFGDRIALIHSEASEALEAYREYGDLDARTEHPKGKPVGVPSELADIVIRVADLAAIESIDLEEHVREKMIYNRTRPYRHGKAQL